MTDYILTLTVSIGFLWAASMYCMWMAGKSPARWTQVAWGGMSVLSLAYSIIPGLILYSVLSH